MKIGIFGTGYVGLVTGTCLADMGHEVTCMDIDKEKIALLKSGKSPIHEPGLTDLLEKNLEEGRLRFTTTAKDAVQNAKAVFIAVGTPQGDDGNADLSSFMTAAEEIARHATDGQIIVDKSTVPVGTAKKVEALFEEADKSVHVVSNPETLREGSAVEDFTKPDRILIGARSEQAFETMREVYGPFALRDQASILEMSPESAELVKYGANAMLAQRISFINFLSRLAKQTGADIRDVRRGIGSDHRIGMQFLYPGPGYGGSCFPKDVSALAYQAAEAGTEPLLPRATIQANEQQKQHVIDLVRDALGSGQTVAVWGLAFKARTDDVRESASIDLAQALLEDGKHVLVHDPEATENFLEAVPKVTPGEKDGILEEADVLAVMTEWDEYRTLSEEELALLAGKTVVDGRNILARKPEIDKMRANDVSYVGVGIPT